MAYTQEDVFTGTVTGDINMSESTGQMALANPWTAARTTYSLTRLAVNIYFRNGTTKGNVYAAIWTNVVGSPDTPATSAAGISAGIACSALPTSGGTMVNFDFSSPPTITQGTKYWYGVFADYSDGGSGGVGTPTVQTFDDETNRMEKGQYTAPTTFGTWTDLGPSGTVATAYSGSDGGGGAVSIAYTINGAQIV